MTRLILPVPPSVNHAYRNVTIGRRRLRVLTAKGEAFKNEAGWLAKEWMQKSGWRMPDASKKVIVRMWVYWPNAKRRDADNLWKLTLDSLKEIVFADDHMCLPQVWDFEIDRNDPRIELEFEVPDRFKYPSARIVGDNIEIEWTSVDGHTHIKTMKMEENS